jgi:GT2 family glycosyltransferase
MSGQNATTKVSIVVPTYNHLGLLKACLDSIRLYTDLSRVEVVVVANGCTDGTEAYLKTLPEPFRHVIRQEPLGYTAATNVGIREARGEYVLLLNNDTALLPQAKHLWIDLMLSPFLADPKVGVTGPVKFSWDCGGIERRAMAFWCVMIPRRLFSEIGLLDEVFSPGTGEDGDFCIKAELAGYRLVQVPDDVGSKFGDGIPVQHFPIYHLGSGTFRDKDYSEITKRNTAILESRYGKKSSLEIIYEMCLRHKCDTNELFPVLRSYAEKCDHLTEFGVRGVFTTWAFLARRPRRMVSYDIDYNPNIEGAKKEAAAAGISFEFRQENTLDAVIEPTDLLFIDTTHSYAHLKAELAHHAASVRKYILIHDTESFGTKDEIGDGPGEKLAITEFLAVHPEWSEVQHIKESNGMTVLGRKAVAVSIVIPTCGKDWGNVLKRCIEAVIAYTDLSDKEIIVIPNGAPREAIEYLATQPLRGVGFPGRIGYIPAVNEGIKVALGEHVVLLDDDSFLMPQAKNEWINLLKQPFQEDKNMAAAGPASFVYDDLGQVLHSGCTMYLAAALRKIGLFDEAFNPGYMGDEDLSIRLRKAGFSISEVPKGTKTKYVNGVREGFFPLVHMGNVQTMDKQADLPIIIKNRALLYERHAPKADAGTKSVEQRNPKDDLEASHLEQGAAAMGLDLLRAWGPSGEAPGSQKPLHGGRGMAFFDMPGSFSSYVPAAPPPSSVPAPAPAALAPKGPQKVSIVIPTFNHLEDLLKPCINTILEFTDLEGVEVIVVANGCTDGTEEYVKTLGPKFRLVSFQDALGYTRATNEGIKVATGDFIIFYNNDNMLLPQRKNDWLSKLLAPYVGNPKMGITGPLQLHDDYADADVIIGFCLCISRPALEAAGGLLDEIYSPGGGEDIDICCKVREKGFVVRQVPDEGKLGYSHTNVGDFPIWHKNNQTFKDIPEYTNFIIKKNGLVNLKKYNKNIKLNIGSGGIEHKGYLSVDLYDRRANIIMDVTKLDFPENSVSEMMAIHVFEHLNPYHCLDILKRWNKILKPGAKLIMEMPDIEALCKSFLAGNTGQRYGTLNAVYGSVNTTGEGDPSNITSPHLYGWWKQSLWDHLANSGYVDIEFMAEQHPHPEANLRVEARKPA